MKREGRKKLKRFWLLRQLSEQRRVRARQSFESFNERADAILKQMI
jgi:hypothetical protein